MRKFTNVQKEHFRHLVLDCIVQIDYARKPPVRADLKRDVKKNLTHLQKDRFAYVSEFFDRIEEIRYIQKRLWKITEDNPDKPILQKSCLSELHQSTLTLCNLYDVLPAAMAVRPDFVNGSYDSGERDNPLYLSSNQARE
jgi:hypothetical protein